MTEPTVQIPISLAKEILMVCEIEQCEPEVIALRQAIEAAESTNTLNEAQLLLWAENVCTHDGISYSDFCALVQGSYLVRPSQEAK